MNSYANYGDSRQLCSSSQEGYEGEKLLVFKNTENQYTIDALA